MKTKTPRLPHEILEAIQTERYVQKRVELLKNLEPNEAYAFKTIIQGQFMPSVEFDLPEGTPPYTPNQTLDEKQRTHISSAIKSLAECVKTSKNNRIQKETAFIKLLESVHEKDAEILIAMKDKKLNEKFSVLKERLIREAYPTLLPVT